MKFAVLGAGGQLGRDLCARLTGEVLPLLRQQADLTWPEALRSTLAEQRPDAVVNCAAYNFVDRAESEPEAAWAVNTWGVKALAEICRDLDCTFLHFSTDYVFGIDAGRRTPYKTEDAPGPVSVYGLSKLAGEYFVRAIAPRHYVVRTCGLYGLWGSGGKGGNFVETMLRLAGEGKPLRVVADQECTPTFTVDLAEAALELMKTERFGLYHLVNGGSCSWFEFARTIFELAGLKPDLAPVTTATRQTPARRPQFSVLESGMPLRPWQEALRAYLSQRTAKGSPARLNPSPAS
jgi:dTDP-4-dehydrorhamnose reductase